MRDALRSLTVRGRAFLAAGSTTTVCAVVLGFDALMRVGVLAMTLPLLTAFLVARTRYRLMAARAVQPGRIGMGEAAEVRVDLVNRGRLPVGMLLFEDQRPPVLGRPARFTLDRMGPSWQRAITYRIDGTVRGHYTLGPLTVRISDPFGFIALSRSFTTTTPLVVAPRVEPLTPLRLGGGSSQSGDTRLRSAASGTAEDVTVREYQQGDDLRRVHWRSTARAGALMVRREERHWQDRATLLVDARAGSHAGVGADSSLEWAVGAAASIGVHLEHAGYGVRLLTDRPGPAATQWRSDRTDAPARTSMLLDQLCALTPSPTDTLANAVANLTTDPGLVVAVLGACGPRDLEELGLHLPGRVRKLALLLDVSTWGPPTAGPTLADQRAALMRAGWRVSVARAGDSVDPVWRRLGQVPVAPSPAGATA